MKTEKKEDLVEVRIPFDQLNPTVQTKTVIVNGKRYDIQRGKTVSVPVEVRDVLIEAGEI